MVKNVLDSTIYTFQTFTNSCYCDLIVSTARDTTNTNLMSSILSSIPIYLRPFIPNILDHANLSIINTFIRELESSLESNLSLCAYVHGLIVDNIVSISMDTHDIRNNQTLNDITDGFNILQTVKMIQRLSSQLADYLQVIQI